MTKWDWDRIGSLLLEVRDEAGFAWQEHDEGSNDSEVHRSVAQRVDRCVRNLKTITDLLRRERRNKPA